ncbi:NADH-quinone oxidoreductase subunit N [Pseudodesulfovibrio hydrargyri]|uniref:NADH-quinone oxidoreductase subunit N n=1 Tax=Pseudodesulfovibrio hydrargyri TaxID=2125990 RepID=A0A1J5MTD8_9BACT|nr:NADH-quinone oxidoreductase subunit N [Pseudodesulfovibrio hydrargyri]OIQ49132.1 NADH-quinone oxidoreductase subunit N [Pseudodesulfovibrio hydrargyri]
MHDILLFAPHLLLTLGILLCFVLGTLFKRPAGLYGVTFASTLLAGALGMAAYPSEAPLLPALKPFLATDALTAYFLPLICALGLGVLLFFGGELKRKGHKHDDELYALFLIALLGGVILAGGRNWLAFFLGLELLSLPLYILIGLRKDSGGTEASVKYFVMGATASGILLFGTGLIYAGSGSLDIAHSLRAPEGGGTVLVGLAMVLAGVAFKLSLAPFHLWAPDVYRGAPASVAALLTSMVKAAVGGGLLRIVLDLGPDLWPATVPVLWGLAALTMLAANLAALAQDSLKRMLGFSSAAHMGYLLMGVLCVNQAGPGPVMFYAAALAVMDLAAFGGLSLLDDGTEPVDTLASLRGLGRSRPWAAGLLAAGLAALAGLPPTAGFTGKLLLFRATIMGGYNWLGVIGILGAALSVFYYLRPLVALYLREGGAPSLPERLTVAGGVAVFLVLLALVGLGVAPSPVLQLIP